MNNIKEKMRTFFDDLLSRDSMRVDVVAADELSVRFFKIAVPAVVMGIALGMSPDVAAKDVAADLPEMQTYINAEPAPNLNSLMTLAKNKEEAGKKYGQMAYMGDSDRLVACEVVLGDTFNEMAEGRAKTMNWLLDYAGKDKKEETLRLLESQCLGSGRRADAVSVSENEVRAREVDPTAGQFAQRLFNPEMVKRLAKEAEYQSNEKVSIFSPEGIQMLINSGGMPNKQGVERLKESLAAMGRGEIGPSEAFGFASIERLLGAENASKHKGEELDALTPKDLEEIKALIEQMEKRESINGEAHVENVRHSKSKGYTEGPETVDEVAQLARDAIVIGYQNHALEQNITAFNQVVMSDEGVVINEGPKTAAQAFAQHVGSKKSAAGWASAAFAIAEGLARVMGHDEIAKEANRGAYFSNRGDNYYHQGKRELGKDNSMRSAQGIGRILNEVGRDFELERARTGNRRYSY